MPLLPADIERRRHVEPFAGGAALFFARRPTRALLCDKNEHLCTTFVAVRDDVEGVVRRLGALASTHDRQRYYERRREYNGARLSTIDRAALFIYLNKTCFNGLHRVNRQGEFNVPAGAYSNPTILNAQALRAASAALRDVAIEVGDFERTTVAATSDDFVYFDPPYEPTSKSASFTAYAIGGFLRSDQERLRTIFGNLDERGCKVMLSGSDVPLIRSLYSAYRIDRVLSPRSVSCAVSSRHSVPEVVIRNYA